MKPDPDELARLEEAIAVLETRRSKLGDEVADAAVRSMLERLNALREETEQEQRKLVTVLFADLAQSTSLFAQLDPEDVNEIQKMVFACWSNCIEAQGGVVEKYIGDAVVAVFGLYVSNEIDPRRAIRAGLAMREALHDLNLDLAMRVGIDTGRVVISTLGDSRERGLWASGASVSLASRLQAAAPVNEILISHATYRHVNQAFDLEKRQPLQVKGYSHPVQTYLVKRERPCAFQIGSQGVAGVQTPMVGRGREMEKLQKAYTQVVETGETGLAILIGEAGIGKTRLMCMFDQWLSQRPGEPYLFRARARQQMGASPYSLLRQAFYGFAGILESDSVSEACHKLEAVLRQHLSGATAFKAHILGALLGFDFSHSPHVRSFKDQPGQLHKSGYEFLEEFFASLASEAPVLVLLEDIHWADELSLEALARLVCANANLPLLMVCSARPELPAENPIVRVEVGPAHGFVVRLTLAPLAESECQQLAAIILKRIDPAPKLLIRLIVNQAEGNPYYLEEIIKDLLEEGVIVPSETDEAWRVDENALIGWRPPPTLTALLEARLDRLPRVEKRLLQQAAVVGRNFWDAAVSGIQSGTGPPEAGLADLCQRELIVEHEVSAFRGAAEYSFRHQLLRDVAYRSILKRQRGPLHGQVAEWLAGITQENERGDEYSGEIASHYRLAGDPSNAARWYLRAGELAKRQGAFGQAYQHFEQAIELDHDAGAEARWPALLGRSETALILGEMEARHADDLALVALAQASGNDSWLAEAHYRQGFACDDERRALEIYQQGLAAARRANNRRLEALILAVMALSLTRLGDHNHAARRVEEALKSAQHSGDPEVRARVLTNAAVYYLDTGDLGRGIRAADEAIALCRELENLLGQVIGLLNLGYIYVQLGLPEQGRQQLQRACELAGEIGAQAHGCYALLNLGLAAWRCGALDEAQVRLEEALAQAVQKGDPFGTASSQTYLALTYESMGAYGQAADHFGAALDAFLEFGVSGPALDARAGLARCMDKLGQLEAARQHGGQTWEVLESQGGQGLEFPMLAYQTCVELFAAVGQEARSERARSAGAHELMDRARRIQEPAWRRAYLENIPEHRVFEYSKKDLEMD